MNARTLPRIAATLAAASIAALLAATPVRAAEAHDHGAAAPQKLALDHGRKWATDASLRQGMARIRGLAEPALAAAPADRTAADWRALATGVEAEVAGIVANCKLEPRADAMLHLLLAKLGDATDAIAGRQAHQRPQQGLVQLVRALDDYGRYFEDAAFRPLRARTGTARGARAG